MNIKYDIQKIKNIISDFANITGISMALLDTNFKYIVKYEYNEPELCKKIQKSEKGVVLCHHSDTDMLQKCRRAKGFVSHVCHAGITDSAMPIIKDGVISGYIILGRIRQTDDIGDIYENIRWMGESADALKDSYLKLSFFNESQLESISNLVSNILFVNAITVEFDEPVRSITEYINRNLRGDLSVARLCKISHTSKNMLYKCFRDVFDCTVNEYITSKRIETAKRLLESGDKTVSDIGEIAGIENTAQFCRLFKKNTGISPSAYRREARGEHR